jgi:carbonic anhydrase/acetyltransferase-like protein (isoleucine patch superfamily)
VRILENGWIGDSAIICKGVTIGENSIVGAGSVVRRDVPDNVVVAGNPASVVRRIDPEAEMTRRSDWFADPARLLEQFDLLDRENLRGNTVWGWVRTLVGLGKGG